MLFFLPPLTTLPGIKVVWVFSAPPPEKDLSVVVVDVVFPPSPTQLNLIMSSAILWFQKSVI